jgi:hypothetical protein
LTFWKKSQKVTTFCIGTLDSKGVLNIIWKPVTASVRPF